MKKKKFKARQPTNVNINKNILNTGYSEGGASLKKTSLKSYNPIKSSAKSDIDANLAVLRNRSSDMYLNAPLASSAINTNRTNTIGAGLSLSPKIKYKILGLSAKEATEWQTKTKEEFELWANSKFCDLYNRNNFYDLQDIAYVAQLVDGDSFAAFHYRKSFKAMPYSLRIQLFEGTRVCNPNLTQIFGIGSSMVEAKNEDNGNRIISGVEIDNDGAVVAYHVANRVPYDPTDNRIINWTRVEAFGKNSHMPNILQIAHDERTEQYRGVPYLAPVITELKQITRYTEAELASAVIKSYFSVFLKQTMPGGDLSELMGNSFNDEDIDPSLYKLGVGTIQLLPPGYDVTSMDPGRSLSTFEPFTTQLIRQIAGAIELPPELLLKTFNASYSASKAALLQAWTMFKMRRKWFARDFCQPVYEAWLSEAVAIGRIKAEGFFSDPLIRRAWCNANWYGPVMGMIDPVKDITGAHLRRIYGFSTAERETAEMMGENFDEVVEQLALEKSAYERANLNIEKVTGVKNE